MVPFILGKLHEEYMKSSWEKISSLIPKDASVLDIGCGKGELLFFLSGKIRKGTGLDKSYRKIGPALEKLSERRVGNLEFFLYDIRESPLNIPIADVGIISGVLHTIDYSSQARLFENSKKMCKRMIVLDYDFGLPFPKNPFIYIEEILAGHYSNFKSYFEKNVLEDGRFKNNLKVPNKPLKIWEYD